MTNKLINDYVKYGSRTSWDANFVGGQSWTRTVDIDGGYGGWCMNQGYYPYVDTANSLIKWQSTYNWYYSQGLFHMVEPSTVNIGTGIIEGIMYGLMNTGYHRQTTSYNFLCSSASNAQDDGYYRFVRNTNGLSFAIQSAGNYDGSITTCKAYLNGTLLGTVGSIGSCNTNYTVKFKLVGENLYAYFSAGDQRNTNVTYNLISSNINQSTLTGRNTIIWIAGWATNDQGESMYGEIRSISLKNNR